MLMIVFGRLLALLSLTRYIFYLVIAVVMRMAVTSGMFAIDVAMWRTTT